RQRLERAGGVPAPELELAHVAHVEAADGGADGAVLLDDPGVLDRHVPAAEADHPGAEAHVGRVERSALQGRRLRLAHAAPSRGTACATSAIMASAPPLFNRATPRDHARTPPRRGHGSTSTSTVAGSESSRASVTSVTVTRFRPGVAKASGSTSSPRS